MRSLDAKKSLGRQAFSTQIRLLRRHPITSEEVVTRKYILYSFWLNCWPVHDEGAEALNPW
jgi:hypothetical protein